MNILPTKFKTKSEFIQNFIIEPIIDSTVHIKKAIESMSKVNENNITYEVVRYLKNESKYKNLYQSQLIKTIVRQKQINPKSINEPDLEILIFSTQDGIIFEAKRINGTNSISIYCGNEGFGRFSGYYEIRNYCGMLGYMEKGDIIDRKTEIKSLLSTLNVRIVSDLNNNCFLSYHHYKNQKIKGYHIILDLT
jgi:hypothetical protein